MNFNQFSNNSDASAWSDDSCDVLFNVVHSRIALHLGYCAEVNPTAPLVAASPFRFVVRCHPNEAERLWGYVHEDSVKKQWEFEFDGEKTRLHSATELKCLQHWVKFLNFDARLLFFFEMGSPVAVVNIPLKRVHSTHVLPPGVLDTAGVLPTLQNKTASYALWSNKMKSDYRGSGLATLESVNSLDLWELKLMTVYPLQYTKGVGGKESYVLVFIPGYRHKQEN